jgi:hypothetical protein
LAVGPGGRQPGDDLSLPPPPLPIEERFPFYDETDPEEALLVSSSSNRSAEDGLIVVGCAIMTTFILSLNLPEF